MLELAARHQRVGWGRALEGTPAVPESFQTVLQVVAGLLTCRVRPARQVAIPGPELPLQPSFDPELGYNRYLTLDAPGGWIAQ